MNARRTRLFAVCGLAWAVANFPAAQAQTYVEKVVLAFSDFPSGSTPLAPLLRAADGALYGTTSQGGAVNLGVVFAIGPSGYKVVYSFKGGTDGSSPDAGVIQDPAGNLYGTTTKGGSANAGVVYKIDASGHETVLYSFTGGADGGAPYAGVIADAAGNLYGTTYQGGTITNCPAGCGVVYEVNPSGQETVLHSFTGLADGAYPYAGLTWDSTGNLYGTASGGGSNVSIEAGYGVIFKLNLAGQETVLHAFKGGDHGTLPKGGVTLDAAGNLYGTTWADGGMVYKLDTTGHLSALYSFPYGFGAQGPTGTLALDGAGNLYGTTEGGGPAGVGVVFKVDTAGDYQALYAFTGGASNGFGYANPGVILDAAGEMYGTTPYTGLAGMVYKLSPSGKETTLYSFQGAPGGTEPRAGLTPSASGDLYGATAGGGAANAGVVYRVDAAGRETVLYAFSGGDDGAFPQSSVVLDAAANVYGAALEGGRYNEGVIYKIDPEGNETVLYTFTGGADGGYPNGVVLDSAGNIYGTTAYGGAGSETGLQEGVVFMLSPSGQEWLLYSFTGLGDGGVPNQGLIRDADGDLYGTTYSGGTANGGTVYKIDTAGNEVVLFSFPGGVDGDYPYGGVIRDANGNLYGTTGGGGAGRAGVVYKLTPEGDYSVLYSFTGGADGGGPMSGVVMDAKGNLHGTTASGGTLGGAAKTGCGVVYKVSPLGQETVLHSFTGGADGSQPWAGVVLGPAGEIFGTAPWGGKGGTNDVVSSGGGLIYRLGAQ